jgi:ribonucleotide reductase beta subunit family protein with ferritin-like domain
VNLNIQATDQLMDRGTGRILLEKDLKKWNEKLKDHEKCFIPYALTFFAASD